MPTIHNNGTNGYQWCVVLPDKTKSKGYLVAHQSITCPGGKLEISGIPGKWEITGADHVRISQGQVVIEKGGAKQHGSMPTTLAGLIAGQRPTPAAAKPAAAGPVKK